MLGNVKPVSNGSNAVPISEMNGAKSVSKASSLFAEDYSKMSTSELNAAFVLAVKKHDAEKMQKLIEAGADVETPISYVWTSGDCDWNVETSAYVYARRRGESKLLRVLINAEKNVNKALHLAAGQGFSDLVKEFIEKGANPNDVSEGKPPLFDAIGYGSPSIVEELIRAGADINYVDKDKDTPLTYAVKCSYDKITSILLEAGANIAHVDKHGKTPLMMAVSNHDFNTVEKLLQLPKMTTGSFFGFGTKPINYADDEGNTALILAVKKVRYSYIVGRKDEYNDCLNSQSIVKALLAVPEIDLHHENQEGETAITLLEKLKKTVNRYPY